VPALGSPHVELRSPRRAWAHWWPVVLLFLAASIFYNLSFPVMEGSDEPFHYGYVEQLRRGGGFPDPTRAPENLAQYESSQAPLFYLTAAAASRLVPGLPDWDGEVRLNRWFGSQPVEFPDNKNIFLHNLDSPEERFQGVARGVRVARLVSTLYGALTVLAAYLVAREVTGGVPWLPLVAAAMVAFNPQFIQTSAVVENDTGASAFVGLALWRLACIVRRRPAALWEYALAGLFVGLATISKSSALIALPLAAIGLGLAWWQERRVRSLPTWLGRAAIVFGVALLAGGWWYARNWLLYADPLRNSAYDTYPWMYPEPHPIRALLPDLPRSLLSYWADLGYSGDIRPTRLFYVGAWLIVALALAGLLRYFLGRRPTSGRGALSGSLVLLVACSGALTVAMYVRLQQIFSFAWGRHLLTSVAAFGTLLAVGLYHLWPRRGRVIGQAATAFLAAYAFLIPPLTLLPSYLPPRVDEFPPLAERLDWAFGDVVRLVGYDVDSRVLAPGEDTVVTLCWETLSRPPADYAFALHFVGPGNARIGARDSYHGLGRYPSSAWRVNDRFCDRVRVRVDGALEPARLYQMRIAVYEPDTLEALPVTIPGGAPAPTFAGWLKSPSTACVPSDAVSLTADVRFGEAIALRGYRLSGGSTPALTLYWEALAVVDGDYTVFVHVVDGQGQLVAQSDAPPRAGQYPTWAWGRGEVIEDTHPLDALPTGEGPLRVLVGLYQITTGERLPASEGKQPLPDNALDLVTIDEIQ
jgi:4-amino-4-deoxy-L-arabinose transferase-like glycosyltransferase